MRIFTDCPERLPARCVVREPAQGEVILLFKPQSAPLVVGTGKPVYLVGNRIPMSVAEAGAGCQLIRPADLDRLLALDAASPVQEGFDDSAGTVATPQNAGAIPGVIVSYSPGTNVGKTFIACNMAAWLALRGRPTVLLDLDMEGSGTWEMLGWRCSLKAAPTVAGWSGDPAALRQAVLDGLHPTIDKMYLIKRGSGTDAQQVVTAVHTLVRLGFSVVVDTANNQELPYIGAVLRVAERVFLVATLTLKVQTRLAEMYAMAYSAGAPVGGMVLCVNRVGSPDDEKGLRPGDLARQFMLRRHYVVHEDARGRRAAVKKRTLPVAMGSPLGRELTAMFGHELEGPPQETASQSLPSSCFSVLKGCDSK